MNISCQSALMPVFSRLVSLSISSGSLRPLISGALGTMIWVLIPIGLCCSEKRSGDELLHQIFVGRKSSLCPLSSCGNNLFGLDIGHIAGRIDSGDTSMAVDID